MIIAANIVFVILIFKRVIFYLITKTSIRLIDLKISSKRNVGINFSILYFAKLKWYNSIII